MPRRRTAAMVLCAAVVLYTAAVTGQKIAWSAEEKPIADQIGGLRQLPDDVRARVTKELAIRIRQLPKQSRKTALAGMLANLSTEGDFGRDTLQEVASTLAEALREQPLPARKGEPASQYVGLAQLVRYEDVQESLNDPQFGAALANLEAAAQR